MRVLKVQRDARTTILIMRQITTVAGKRNDVCQALLGQHQSNEAGSCGRESWRQLPRQHQQTATETAPATGCEAKKDKETNLWHLPVPLHLLMMMLLSCWGLQPLCWHRWTWDQGEQRPPLPGCAPASHAPHSHCPRCTRPGMYRLAAPPPLWPCTRHPHHGTEPRPRPWA